jgi:hypothetical protein
MPSKKPARRPPKLKRRLPRTKRAHTKKHPASKKQQPYLADVPADLNDARRFWMEGHSIRSAAHKAGVSESRLRRLVKNYKLGNWDRKRRRWRYTDRRKREITIISDGQYLPIFVRGFAMASLGMRHRAAVEQFLNTNDTSVLAPFEGHSIIDTGKHRHFLDTRANVLLRLANAGSDAEMRIYRLMD